MTRNEPAERLERLLGFLKLDPGNPELAADVAEAALAAGRPETARHVCADAQEVNERLAGAAAVAAMQTGAWAEARGLLEPLHAAHPDNAVLRWNLAWTLQALGDANAALEVLDAAVVNAMSRAARLKIQLLHNAGAFEAAEAAAREALLHHNDDADLFGTISVLAMDVEDSELARACAERGGDNPDALSTLGMLTLEDGARDEAFAMFDAAVAKAPRLPRAWIGRGLALLGDEARRVEAADNIELGAGLFVDHVGSWIAAGWARLIAGDPVAAESLFQKAMDIDRTFGETHGSLAVIHAMRGETEAARRAQDVAFRLDPQCFSAALARAMLLAGDGREDAARRVLERALNTPLDDKSTTLADMLGRMAR